jgi:hypothetical protein
VEEPEQEIVSCSGFGKKDRSLSFYMLLLKPRISLIKEYPEPGRAQDILRVMAVIFTPPEYSGPSGPDGFLNQMLTGPGI